MDFLNNKSARPRTLGLPHPLPHPPSPGETGGTQAGPAWDPGPPHPPPWFLPKPSSIVVKRLLVLLTCSL